MIEFIFKGYLVVAFMAFTAIFFFSALDVGHHNPRLKRKFRYLDVFFLSVACGVSWPYAIILLFFRGAGRGPRV